MYADTVTIERASTSTDDAFGNPTNSWSALAEDVPAVVQPVGSAEQVADRDTVTTRYRMHCDPDVDITAQDRVVWRGRTFQVDGDVEQHSRRGAAHHQEMFLRTATA